jgi:hypothetical protein
MRYLKATLQDGTEVIGQFSKLEKVGRYIAQVFAGQKPFNVYKTVGDTLPSGEKGALRTRETIRGSLITRIVEVNEGGTPIAEIPRGTRGRWTVPSNSQIEGLVPGTVYPKHRNARSLRDFVIVKAATPTSPAVHYYIGDTGLTTLTPEPGDGDDISADDLEPVGASR